MFKRLAEFMLRFGSYPEETQEQRAKRRIVVVAISIATGFTILSILGDYAAGYAWVAVSNAVLVFAIWLLLFGLHRSPRHFAIWINAVFAAAYVQLLAEVALTGGLIESGLSPLFAFIIGLAALIAFGVRSAFWWFGAFFGSVVFSLVISDWVDPIYVIPDPTFDAAFNLTATAFLVLAVLIYFIRQRDRFQKESDDLLHNILPDEIARRLKASSSMIADSYDSASVLFADVVDFTPMTAAMPPEDLVGLLNSLFSSFDRLVEELGLEKIKTVGDEYIVASGIPAARPDHAQAVAELALRMRECLVTDRFGGHQLRMRIGINSGSVIAGVVGTHKFAYDLWGDAVNTASRMESEGVEGSIQISEATYRLIKDEFMCDPRGSIPIKGKGSMNTYLLVSRRPPA
jgi:adenylate cyclase